MIIGFSSIVGAKDGAREASCDCCGTLSETYLVKKLMRSVFRTMGRSSGICGVLENPSQAVGGFIVSHRIGDWPQPSDKQTGDRMWTMAWFWFTMHWRAIALTSALIMIFISFALLGYGFYVDYLLMARARRRGYSEIEAVSGIRRPKPKKSPSQQEEAEEKDEENFVL